MNTTRSQRHTQIGLDRLVRLKWLEKTASLVLAGNDERSIKAILQDDLRDSFVSGNPQVRGSLDKTITILTKVWVSPPPDVEGLWADGLALLRQLPRADHIVVHWGMVTGAYPFWASVAIQVGRLLNLQGTAIASQIQRRTKEQYGERETVSRRARYVLRSYVDWGVLQETSTKGVYNPGQRLAVDDPRLVAWLCEASLHAQVSESAPFKQLMDSPSLFPFRLTAIHPEKLSSAAPRLDVLRHGLQETLITLRR